MKTPDANEVSSLVRTALGEDPADVVITGGQVVNVYSRELVAANVTIKGDRIAYVGSELPGLGPDTVVIEASGLYLVPGFIEPHAHPVLMYNPFAYATALLPRGTTTVVGDSYWLMAHLGAAGLTRFIGGCDSCPLKFLWFVRPHSPSLQPLEEEICSLEGQRLLLSHPQVLGWGEATRWYDMVQQVPRVLTSLAYSLSRRKRLDGHTAGASGLSLAALAAAGISGCHEAINVPQALERLRLGMYVALRDSSIRHDLGELSRLITENGVDTSRLLLTTDGPTPATLAREGHTDTLLARVIEAGVDPLVAVQMATINPATYWRIDDQVGSISPGRYADILLVRDLRCPVPETVLASGEVVARNGKLVGKLSELDWEELGIGPLPPREISPGIFAIPAQGTAVEFPVIQVSATVLTRRREMRLPVRDGVITAPEGVMKIACIDSQGRQVANGFITGLADGIDALASSYHVGLGVLAVGKTSEAMARAVASVYRMGGGLALLRPGEPDFHLPLPLLGLMSPEPVEALAAGEEEFNRLMRACGYHYECPLYTIFFLSASDLPDLRITPRGLYDNRQDKILRLAREITT
ncbi:MAG: adenine deaminase [Clostridia bacterium]|nr:MAG: adenine deaminase [Clostridia bacterium]